MQILRDLTPSKSPTAVALGYFDGVHRGHRAVLSEVVKCKAKGLIPAAFTFASTPKPNDRNLQLSTYDDKIEMLKKTGIELLYIIDFSKVKNKTPEEFIREIVSGVFNAKQVFCGFNYRFGKMGKGTTDDLIRLCKECGISAGVSAPVTVDGMLVSSSEIRKLLRNGDIKTANKLLGYDFGLKSISVEGNHLGTAMETPTINQLFEPSIVLPKYGVYASVVTIDGETHAGVTNIGVKPTVGDYYAPNCETWMPLYKGGNLYGKTVEVRLKEFLRPEKKFNSISELEKAIKHDGETAVSIISKINRRKF